MKITARDFALAGGGFLAGLAASLSLLAGAQTERREPNALFAGMERITRVYELIRSNYVRELPDQRIIDGCLRGMAVAADGESGYMDKDDYADLTGTGPRPGAYAALGLELASEDFQPKIVSIFSDTRAARDGKLRRGDVISSIDGVDTRGLTLRQVTQMLRGAPDTPVVLEVRHPGDTTPEKITALREVVRASSVQARRLDSGLAYVEIKRLGEGTERELAAALRRSFEGGAPAGLVLDLRNNQGGLLTASIAVSAAFLPPATPVVNTRGRNENANKSYRADPLDYSFGTTDPFRGLPLGKTVPMVVLVNQGTASGAEIIAGALQDHQRARIVGEVTYGRGGIRTIFPLPERTGLRLTTAQWVRPSGRPIEPNGVTPDELVAKGTAGDAQLARAEELLKAK